MALNLKTEWLCTAESDSLHEDVREGRIPKAEDKVDGGDKDDGQITPSNGMLDTHTVCGSTQPAVIDIYRDTIQCSLQNNSFCCVEY